MQLTLIASGIGLLFGIWSVLPCSISSLSSANVNVRDSSAIAVDLVGTASRIISKVRDCPVILSREVQVSLCKHGWG